MKSVEEKNIAGIDLFLYGNFANSFKQLESSKKDVPFDTLSPIEIQRTYSKTFVSVNPPYQKKMASGTFIHNS